MQTPEPQALIQVHGGGIRQAAARYRIPEADWLDLSTGINPHGYPAGELPPGAWARLPEPDDGLEAAAATYYGTGALLPVPGSQAAIQLLPALREGPSRVGILEPSYNEHARAWHGAGHDVVPLDGDSIEAALPGLDVLLLVNPNNPTGQRFHRADLLAWHAALAARGGWLIVDEAFMDVTPEASLATDAPRDGLVVLRSLGKFFGLAGARVGFVIAEGSLRTRLAARMGPWGLAGPSRWIATQALSDRAWQAGTRGMLQARGQRLADLLRDQGLEPAGGTALFQWCRVDDPAGWQDHLGRQGILVRRFDEPGSLRFGLPGPEHEWKRLEQALGAS
ncbi:threonine-phosphate decarboxylase CobD [Thioalkalivibrio versutus]|uniref:threonine-phosphate decarboxylase CobD n=1 Tax=Thioalkalivibrio versutus TaxID=106634 RepID=UPI00037E9C0F|nr:threonine-phosphate decarboxylase CobD [Thioalkalivibrio versutus]OOC50934.1 threonine-phosphate decarboxylase [Thioalkalivibrio versutus]